MPKVSVIIPSYNATKYLPRTLKSVLNQTFRDIEIIVVDDGSTDNIRMTLEPYMDRIRYIHQENKRRSGARNTGINNATGEYIAFLDSDDIWLPHKIEKQVAVLDRFPDVALVCCRALFIDENDRPAYFVSQWVDGKPGRSVEISDMVKPMFLGDPIPGGGSTSMSRLRIVQAIGGFDEDLDYAEDWDTWFRLAHQGLVAYIPRVLACYRVFGWEKVIRREASEELLKQPLRLIEKGINYWTGDLKERDETAASGIAMLFQRASLANFQLGNGLDGQRHLEEAIRFNPDLAAEGKIIELAVDRAKLIEADSGDLSRAEAFLILYFKYPPKQLQNQDHAKKEAFAWLYLGCAFERRLKGDRKSSRNFLWKAVKVFPRCLLNKGVISMGIELCLGKWFAEKLRSIHIFRNQHTI